MSFQIREVTVKDSPWVLDIFRSWGADFVVSRGRKIYPADTLGFLAESKDGRKAGLATYQIVDRACELVTLDAFDKFSGIGTALLERVAQAARKEGCRRLWMITTNDNLDAIRFYQRRGMRLAAIHVGSLAHSRQIKPSIPLIGQYGIRLTDELEFEILFD